jgi:hypothetical protein
MKPGDFTVEQVTVVDKPNPDSNNFHLQGPSS